MIKIMRSMNKPKVEKPKTVKRLHRDDKIFNNSYFHGDKLKGNDYELHRGLTVDHGYSARYLGDIYNFENNINYRTMQNEIISLIETNADLNRIINDPKKKKFNKEIINFIFKIIYESISQNKKVSQFMDPIYIFDCVANISGLKYNNLFDLLDFNYKKILIVELDKNYHILKSNTPVINNLY